MYGRNTATHALATPLQLRKQVEEEGEKQQHVFVCRKKDLQKR